MNLDPAQAQLIVNLIDVGFDKLLIAVLVIALVRANRAPTFLPPAPVVPSPGPPAIPPPVAPPPVPEPVKPPIIVAPPVVVAPPLPPPVVVPPIGVAIPRFNHITATSFAGIHDSTNSKTSAYTGKIIDSSKPGFAIPQHLSAADQKRPIRAFWGGNTVDGPVEDVGPWYDGRPGWPADPYWETGTRPRAETDNRTNHAGIDLTPGAWKALGHPDPENAKDYISWDWADALGPVVPVVPGVPTAPPVTPSSPVAGAIPGITHTTYPSQDEAHSYFGSPGSNLVKVTCPWLLTVEGTHTQSITINAKCAASFMMILNAIWNHPAIGQSQDKINEWGYNIFDGSFNDRLIAGTSTTSQHAWGAALDFNADKNPQHAPISRTLFKPDSLIVQAFKQAGWTWGGDWSPRYIDAMHFQMLKA
jgi:hypothetical protein